jgi:hypothetical protein
MVNNYNNSRNYRVNILNMKDFLNFIEATRSDIMVNKFMVNTLN